jgi:nitronate monooxygenase
MSSSNSSLKPYLMWYNTACAKILGVQYPILQGPFGGGLSSIALAATVSNMGGVGSYGAYTMEPGEIRQVCKDIREKTNKPYNINLWVSDTDPESVPEIAAQFEKTKLLFASYFSEVGLDFPDMPASPLSRFENQAQAVLDARPPAFSFTFGVPSADILEECRKRRIVTLGSATTVDEGLALEAAGVDLIIVSGFEAGGHRPSFLEPAENSLVGTFVLIQQLSELTRTPIIAAGGIASGKGIAAAMTLGADGVQVGTAFLGCEESGAPEFYRNILFSEKAKHTVLTRAFSGRLGRVLSNRIAQEIKGKEKDLLPFPLQSRFLSGLRQGAIDQKKWELIQIWGGQIARLLTHKKASELMAALIHETGACFETMK